MSRSSEQKIKLLILYGILRKNTDENHPMTTNELVAALRECGIEVSRKTIYEDIDILIRYGYDIVCMKGRNNQYFVGEHGFERPEIELLLNAVSTSKLLTQTKSKVLSDKLADLLGKPQGEELKGTVGAVSAKNRNEHVYYAIDAITDALLKKHKLSFLYFDRMPRGEKQYRKNGERYEVNPLGMIYSEDNFYLICFHDKYKDIAHYRIDKMDDVRMEQGKVTDLKEYRCFDVAAYRNELFSMYAGERTEVELRCRAELLPSLAERFGDSIVPVAENDGEYSVRVTVRVSKAFFSWLTMFEGEIKIASTDNVRKHYIGFLQNLMNKA